ncbi:uncharacterized protein N7518_005416 [Penicillium psychrosexuale]|uniref:uncharacterized protein n=1 Tax=Penicillium psychrosexuale TaxID=1002107 RepID=UPI0025456CFD|nr:uncharacterized protein N7518_005416 [Penicillium psychrosexuale]KAJ5796876.1 hypothetical protein N7518_005416 [Penicillium psychrosexuale]
MAQDSSKHIIVVGDAPVHLFLYPFADSTRKSDVHNAYWFRVGSNLVATLLEDGLEGAEPRIYIHKPSLVSPTQDTIHSIVNLECNDSKASSPDSRGQHRTRFKPRSIQEIVTARRWYAPLHFSLLGIDPSALSIVIFQETRSEAAAAEIDTAAAISTFQECRPCFLVYHMARPMCDGSIWETVRRGPLTGSKPGTPDRERLIVVVDANDLRAEGINLSRGLSWEKTCEDFVERLGSVGKLACLATCAHLVVLFGCAGVIYHQGSRVSKPVLLFDPFSSEEEFLQENIGRIPGLSETFVAGLVSGLIQSPELSVEHGIEFGLQAARRLAVVGLADPGNEVPSLSTVYRAGEVMGETMTKRDKLIRFAIPSDDIACGNCGEDWSLLDDTIGDAAEVARQVVRQGPLSLASQVPLAQFNELFLFDRHEIESCRSIFSLLREYLAAPMNRPLSIAVFGPRGSGKAFTAMQLAEAAARGKKASTLRFDLSQFTSVDDMVAAFHSIRDCSLKGSVPLVYLRGFDTDFAGSPLGWLPHLLHVMLSGSFPDHGISRPIGTAVFFFGSASSTTYEALRHGSPTTYRYPNNRIQDFLACLHGFVNILGPDKVTRTASGSEDRLYPVRRAVILRSLLETREANLTSSIQINIDESVLNALLLVPTYRHGIRSLKSIIAMSHLNGRYHFDRSALPPQTQLDLHVDYKIFTQYFNGIPLPDQLRERLAQEIHAVYLAVRSRTATESEKADLKPWHETDEELKESSRAHAEMIPSKLREIRCFLTEKQEHREPVRSFTPAQIERLGEIEHERWNTERLQNQWKRGDERDIAKRSSPLLIPWCDLEQKWQDIDRAIVASYPRILPEEYEIYLLGPKEARTD